MRTTSVVEVHEVTARGSATPRERTVAPANLPGGPLTESRSGALVAAGGFGLSSTRAESPQLLPAGDECSDPLP